MFWEFPSFTRIFNGLQYNSKVWPRFINVLESFSNKDSLFINDEIGQIGVLYNENLPQGINTNEMK
jgi:hypothetical protein